MSKNVAQSERLTLSSSKKFNRVQNNNDFILFISLTQNGRSQVNAGKSITRNTEFSVAVGTLLLLHVQQLQ
jgi:hypothetical protein